MTDKSLLKAVLKLRKELGINGRCHIGFHYFISKISCNIFDWIKEKMMMTDKEIKEVWLNIYKYKKAYVWGSDLYKNPKLATRDLADKEHYLHTINVRTGDTVKVDLRKDSK